MTNSLPSPDQQNTSNPRRLLYVLVGVFYCFAFVICAIAVTLAANLSPWSSVAQLLGPTLAPSTSTPTSTPRPTPTTPIPTQSPAVQVSEFPETQWRLVLSDAFDSNDNGWPEWSDREGTLAIRRGKYIWKVQSPPGSFGLGWPHWADWSREVSDFYAAVEVNATGQLSGAVYGLMFRYSDEGYYIFGLDDQALVVVDAVIFNDSANVMIGPVESPLVRRGEVNRLSVVAVGSRIVFYINDQLFAERVDERLQRGFVGVTVDLTGGGSLAEVEFDNFELQEPASEP